MRSKNYSTGTPFCDSFSTKILSRSSVRENALAASFCPDKLSDSRQVLYNAIDEWRTRYRELFPRALPHPPTDFPENVKLELPSSFNSDHTQQIGLHTIAQVEFGIRLGQAYDAIDDIRTAIHIYNASSRERRTQVFGQRLGTRACTVLLSLKQDIRDSAKQYQSVYSCLVALGLPEDSELKPISEKELWGKDMTSTTKIGDSKQKEPWYWVIGKPKNISNSTWGLERKYFLFNAYFYYLFLSSGTCPLVPYTSRP